MTNPREHSWYEELVPAYALGVADDEERQIIEAHLQACLPCRAQATQYAELQEGLLYSAPAIEARTGLTEDLKKRLEARPGPAPRRAGWAMLFRPGFALGVAALMLLVVTNVYWAGRVARAERGVDSLAELTRAPSVALIPSVPSSHASGVVYAEPAANMALLCVYDLPDLDPGKTYQVWLIQGDKRVSGGTFQIGDAGYGVLLIQSDRPLGEFDGLGITVEPTGGSPAPTTPRVMGGSL